MKFTVGNLITMARMGLQQKEKAEKKKAQEKSEKKKAKRAKKEAQKKRERIKKYRSLVYEQVDDGLLTATSGEGITVTISKSKNSSMWWVRAFRGDLSSRSPHGFPSPESAIRDAPSFINKVAVKIEAEAEKE